MSACQCTHSYHDEIFNFTGVERTNNEIKVHSFDNANDYRMTKEVGNISNDRQMNKINHQYEEKLCCVC